MVVKVGHWNIRWVLIKNCSIWCLLLNQYQLLIITVIKIIPVSHQLLNVVTDKLLLINGTCYQMPHPSSHFKMAPVTSCQTCQRHACIKTISNCQQLPSAVAIKRDFIYQYNRYTPSHATAGIFPLIHRHSTCHQLSSTAKYSQPYLYTNMLKLMILIRL